MKRWKIITLLSVGAAVLLWHALPIRAFNPQPEPPGRYLQSIMPPQGDRLGEGVRLHLLYAPLLTTAGACHGSVSFLNLETGAPAETAPRVFSLAPGKGAVIRFTPQSTLPGMGPTPQGIEPVPWHMRIEVSATPQYCAIASLDVFDVATGRTITTVRY